MFSPARRREVLPGLSSQPSQVGAYSTVGMGFLTAPVQLRIGSSCGRPTSTMSSSRIPTSASA
ncbi:hypothetical protein SMICM304S_03845 [Streptomyces microflavus]